ncbi:MAG: hypothetical protein Q9163_002260 [Psora crenata]
MDYIEHTSNLVAALNTPGLTRSDPPVLDPHISTERLEFAYSQMCDILLELHKHSFTGIGSLSRADKDSWVVTGRPLTMNMNELVQLGNVPRSQLPSEMFSTASTYMQALADMNFMHLATQRNHAVDSANDCRRKYIARHLVRKLASQSRLNNFETSKLFCGDLRPTNVLVNEDFKIVGVIDWEFTYAAPADFAYDPPWWLLLDPPELWSAGLSDWIITYEPRLRTFLRLLEIREEAAIQRGTLNHSQKLSQHMRESWESGRFWAHYGAQKSWALDAVFWTHIDPKYSGSGDWFNDRIKLLDEGERNGLEEFVKRKLEERVVQGWDMAKPNPSF